MNNCNCVVAMDQLGANVANSLLCLIKKKLLEAQKHCLDELKPVFYKTLLL